MADKHQYSKPAVRTWGTVTAVTRGGYKKPKTDMKHGSRPDYGY